MSTVTLTVNPPTPAHGATVTATYAVTGNEGTPAKTGVVTGSVQIGADTFNVSTTVTLPGTPGLPETFSTPTCPGITFAPTGDPRVFTALVP